MTNPTTTAVHRSITVEVDQARAFAVFTAGIDTWWMRSHHIGTVDPFTVVLEPRTGGRWYERGHDGSETEWGYVIAYEPNDRVVLAWQLTSEWAFDKDFVTEVEVTFVVEGPTTTRVDLVHHNLDRYGAAAAPMAEALGSPGGWVGLLAAFAAAAV